MHLEDRRGCAFHGPLVLLFELAPHTFLFDYMITAALHHAATFRLFLALGSLQMERVSFFFCGGLTVPLNNRSHTCAIARTRAAVPLVVEKGPVCTDFILPHASTNAVSHFTIYLYTLPAKADDGETVLTTAYSQRAPAHRRFTLSIYMRLEWESYTHGNTLLGRSLERELPLESRVDDTF